MTTMPVDQFPKYMRVVDYIRQGYLPTRAARMAETSWTSIRKACRDHPEFNDMFFEAMEECRDHLAESLLEIDSDDPMRPHGSTDPKVMKVLSDNIKWLLEKYWPEKFAARLKVEDTRADVLIVEALAEAIKRIPQPAAPVALEYNGPPMIDITPWRSPAPLSVEDLL